MLAASLLFDAACLDLGFHYPELAYPLSYTARWSDVTSSFFIVELFIASEIIMSREYQQEH